MARLRADIVVAALLRQVQGDGGFGAVVKRGEAQAGAIHILVRVAQRQCRHFVPANQSAYGDERLDERLFEEREPLDDADLDAFLQRESRFDPDFWVLELEVAADELPFAVVPVN